MAWLNGQALLHGLQQLFRIGQKLPFILFHHAALLIMKYKTAHFRIEA